MYFEIGEQFPTNKDALVTMGPPIEKFYLTAEKRHPKTLVGIKIMFVAKSGFTQLEWIMPDAFHIDLLSK